MSVKKVGLVAAIVAVSGALLVGGAALADAATTGSSPSPSASGGRGTGDGQGHGGRGGSQDTPVTGDEAAKVKAAVLAKDSAVTVESVRKDPDGSYDVLGTKAGQRVMFDVSADLGTVTQGQAGGRDGARGAAPSGAAGASA